MRDRIDADVMAEAHARDHGPKCYGYAPSVYYRLERDGAEVLGAATELECWMWLHRHTPHSVSHALQYEGWKMVPVTLDS